MYQLVMFSEFEKGFFVCIYSSLKIAIFTLFYFILITFFISDIYDCFLEAD